MQSDQVKLLIEKELAQQLPVKQEQTADDFWEQGPQCRAEILVKTRSELSACGTSILRPEAAAHKVHNASRKPKEVVVEELWQHYLRCHKEDFETEAGWVGNVIDEDEDGAKK